MIPGHRPSSRVHKSWATPAAAYIRSRIVLHAQASLCIILLALLAVQTPYTADAEGLAGTPSFLRASNNRAQLLAQLAQAVRNDAQKLRTLYQPRKASSCRSTASGRRTGLATAGTLCGVNVATVQGKAAITEATSPAVYDARNPDKTGGYNLINPPRDQGYCDACVAFAVTAAAETAMAAALRVNVSDLPALSEALI
eukprot:GHUV01035659.1.p1 GENE.GHUV01035659.1~~GHUV01035659.1.p1  ORF type:complete len:198 (+),score=32.74 GHUV01035659.1:349-942(+)